MVLASTHLVPHRAKDFGHVLIVALVFAFSTLSEAGTKYSTNYAACEPSVCSSQSLVWSSGEFDQIYLVPASTPHTERRANISAQELETELLRVQFKNAEEEWRPLLTPEKAHGFAQGLALAFHQANSSQDVLFFFTSASGLSAFLNHPLGYSGRAFADQQGIQFILGEGAVDFVGPYHGVGKVRHFDFGSVAAASKVFIRYGDQSGRRGDWINLPALQDSVEPASVLSVELRLLKLKQLHDQKLITDAEYLAKKAEILRGL